MVCVCVFVHGRPNAARHIRGLRPASSRRWSHLRQTTDHGWTRRRRRSGGNCDECLPRPHDDAVPRDAKDSVITGHSVQGEWLHDPGFVDRRGRSSARSAPRHSMSSPVGRRSTLDRRRCRQSPRRPTREQSERAPHPVLLTGSTTYQLFEVRPWRIGCRSIRTPLRTRRSRWRPQASRRGDRRASRRSAAQTPDPN